MILYMFVILQFLSRCVVGASLEEAEEEEDNASVSSSIMEKSREGCYDIVGTLKDRNKEKPDFAKEVILVRFSFYIYICIPGTSFATHHIVLE